MAPADNMASYAGIVPPCSASRESIASLSISIPASDTMRSIRALNAELPDGKSQRVANRNTFGAPVAHTHPSSLWLLGHITKVRRRPTPEMRTYSRAEPHDTPPLGRFSRVTIELTNEVLHAHVEVVGKVLSAGHVSVCFQSRQ